MMFGYYVDFSMLIPWLFLALIAVSLGFAAWYLLAISFRRKLDLGWIGWVKQSWCLSTLFFVVLLWLIPLYLRSIFSKDDAFRDSVVLLCSAITCGAVGWWLYHGRYLFGSHPWWGRLVPGVFSLSIAIAIFGGLAFSWRSLEMKSMSRSELLISITDHLQPVNDKVGRTEQGREVPLFAWDSAAQDQHELWFDEGFNPEYTAKMIVRSEPDLKSNCHGWVFAAGEFLLMPEAVEMILADNSFLEVASPLPGDVVVYRDAKGVIVHSGIIRAILGGNTLGEALTILVESKWGLGSCYLHPVECQPYSQNFTFYRRSGGHQGIEVGDQQPTYRPANGLEFELL